ncbi:MAG: hypothetical protein VX871_04605 [Pseudomonadota bacterium]|nr:hypothetical protein [Pseudomonadota bacterium]
MRAALAVFFTLLLLLPPAPARAGLEDTIATPERLLSWMYAYRKAPKPQQVPEAVGAMKKLGLLSDPEKSGFIIGFLAGVLHENPRSAPTLVRKMFPMPPKEQAVIIKAIAYSGLPNWQDLLRKIAPRMPERQLMVDEYLEGKAPTLMAVPLETGTPVIYALWGFYVATGDYEPVTRIITALQWSKDKSEPESTSFRGWISAAFTSEETDVDKITIGGTAKWTLVSYAERDRHLIDYYRVVHDYQPEGHTVQLAQVIKAAEAFEAERIRKEEYAAIEEAKIAAMKKGTGFSKAATAGQIAIATGCVTANALGAYVVGAACVVTGAVYTGAVKLLSD